jgi:hypothetical protein
MTRRRSLILAIVTAGCWIILLAIVLNSVFAASTLTKQIRSKDRQSTQVDDIASTPPPPRSIHYLSRGSGAYLIRRTRGTNMTTVWIYVDTSKEVGDVDHLKVFATQELADEWFKENDPQGVAFGYEVIEE